MRARLATSLGWSLIYEISLAGLFQRFSVLPPPCRGFSVTSNHFSLLLLSHHHPYRNITRRSLSRCSLIHPYILHIRSDTTADSHTPYLLASSPTSNHTNYVTITFCSPASLHEDHGIQAKSFHALSAPLPIKSSVYLLCNADATRIERHCWVPPALESSS